MSPERSSGEQGETDPRLLAFKSVIERAVQPVIDMKSRGQIPIYQAGVIAENRIRIGSGKISFHLLEPGNNVGLTSQGVGGLDHITHGAMIREMNEFHGYHIRSAVFGLNEDGLMLRQLAVGSDRIFPHKTKREIDTEEVGALVDFLTSPHLNLDKLKIIMRQTAGETTSLAGQKQRRQEFDAEIAAEKEKDEEKRRQRFLELYRRNCRPRWLRPLGSKRP